MRCPYCSHDETQVSETRESDEGDVIRRRRRCLKCDKRFTTYERAEIALPAIVRELESGGESEISSETIGEIVMEHLRQLDDVAYVRFASVYRNFREAKDFEAVLGELSGDDDSRPVSLRK